ncbi:MAG TPA: hypothetical protein DCK83_00485 [Gallionellaceae bacterium]|nr:hypothetical protein [Gallionellaceae bacterium]
MSALISFLGGSAFRMIWGEVSAYFTRKQEQAQEIERMRLQGELDAAAHARNIESIKVQAELGVKTIQVQADADLARLDVGAWAQAVADVGRSTGIKFLDIWNGSVRPLLATIAIGVVLFEIIRNGFVLSDWNRELVGAILGIYVADRSLGKRGK